MTALKISMVLTMVGVLALADKPPTGPQVHHFTGQPGFDSFGKSVASQPIYGGPSHDIGVAHHPVSYGHAPSHGYGAPAPAVGYQTAYIAYEPPQPAPQYYVKVKSNPLKDLDKKIKDYASKFTKFMSDYMDLNTYEEESYDPVYVAPAQSYGPPPTSYGAPPRPTALPPTPTALPSRPTRLSLSTRRRRSP
nr:extensin-1-like isoform X1 [Penaeus vannamei]